MSIAPIQVTDEGILIPKVYLDTSGEIELIVTEDFIIVRPKQDDSNSAVPEDANVSYDYPFIGLGNTRDPQASINAEEILEREIKRDSGWSLE